MEETIEVYIKGEIVWRIRIKEPEIQLLRNDRYVAVYDKEIPGTRKVLGKGLAVMIEEILDNLKFKTDDIIP